jgi:phosphopantetheine--protein transferase-like protein
MNVLGHGIDLVQVSRLERMLGGGKEVAGEGAKQSGGGQFIERVYTPAERVMLELQSSQAEAFDLARCAAWQNPASRRRIVERLAARFAGKEAVLKALGTGLADGISWHDVEIVALATGQPSVRLSGRAAAIAQQRGIHAWVVSLSHTHEMAMASVIGMSH